MKKFFLISVVLTLILTACNKDWSFPDYKYSTVYFAYQSPVRTIVLGEDVFDNTLDNQHKCLIMATMGGVYENKNNVLLNVAVDNTLAARLKFGTATGDTVLIMPNNYYSLPGTKNITIPAGKLSGGIEVQLTDAFFQDPLSLKNTYVIPMKILSVQNADSILQGRSNLASPDPRKASDWEVAPKDYILYAVKYINPYHGVYLRRGKAEVKGNGGNTTLDTTLDYRQPPKNPTTGILPPRNTFVERDMLSYLFTKSLTQDTVSLTTRNKGSSTDVPFRLTLTFNANGDIVVSGPSSAVSYTVTGTGKFVQKGDMWGNEKRDVMHLNYKVDFGTTTHNFTDTIVIRDRGVKFETFTPVVIN